MGWSMTIPYVTGKLHGELIDSTYSTYWLDLARMSHWKRLWSFFHIAEVPHSTWGNPVLDFWGSSTNRKKKTQFVQLYMICTPKTHQFRRHSDHHSRDVPGTSPTWTSYLQRPGSLPSGPEAPDHQACAQVFLFNITTFPALGRGHTWTFHFGCQMVLRCVNNHPLRFIWHFSEGVGMKIR